MWEPNADITDEKNEAVHTDIADRTCLLNRRFGRASQRLGDREVRASGIETGGKRYGI